MRDPVSLWHARCAMSHATLDPQPLDRETAASLSQVLHLESRHYVAPFWWGTNPFDANTVRANGSCFFVEIGNTRFGVTAYHVVTAFLACRDMHPSTRLVVRNVDITDWDARFIDGNAEHDVAPSG